MICQTVKLIFLILQVGPPLPAADLLAFVKAAFSCRQAAGGRVFVHSRVGLDSCLLYATLETMLAQGHKDAAFPLYLSLTEIIRTYSIGSIVFFA